MNDKTPQDDHPEARGRVYEDFAPGQIIRHRQGRTVTDYDNISFTLLTNNANEIHFNHDYAARTEWKKPLMNSAFTLALVTGLSVHDLTRNAINLGWDEVRIPHPVFAGDTLYAQTEILECRESKSRPHQGIVKFRTTGFNQDGVVVLDFLRTILVYRNGHVPPRPEPPEIKR